ncbi:MAG: hypothetical protein AAFY57_04005 [Cyanobacteria bacterium J06642_2]
MPRHSAGLIPIAGTDVKRRGDVVRSLRATSVGEVMAGIRE